LVGGVGDNFSFSAQAPLGLVQEKAMPNLQLVKIATPKDLPLNVWKLFFQNIKLYYQNKEIVKKKITTRSGTPLLAVHIGDFLYIEQNPDSPSKYAAMARNGYKILWIIRLNPTKKYVGRVINGRVEKL
jgi:hypothetical protein